MITQPTTVDELKDIFLELFLNHTDKVTKLSPNSGLNGVAFGIAKIGQRTLKDIALIEARLFPDVAYGEWLDKIAEDRGIAPRMGATYSSTYIRVVGEIGTQYLAGINRFRGQDGIDFEIETTTTIGSDGYAYIKVRSSIEGERANVRELSINQLTPAIAGHKYCINETRAVGGSDIESDERFRIRIKYGINLLATGTIASLEQLCISYNPNILHLYYNGVVASGRDQFLVSTVNGIDLTQLELDDLAIQIQPYVNIGNSTSFRTQIIKFEIVNVKYCPIDISFRCDINAPADDIRREAQISICHYLNLESWNAEKVEWDDLLQIIKTTPGITYVYDTYFAPRVDLKIPTKQFPRLRGFLMLDADGNLLSNSSNTLNPVYYPNKLDFQLVKTVYAQF